MSERSKKAREIFYRKGDPLVAISAPSPLAARMLERAGFEYIFLGGEATFGTMIGTPGSYLDTSEKVAIAKYFVKAVNIPVIMDCDEVCRAGGRLCGEGHRAVHRRGSVRAGPRRPGASPGAGSGASGA